MKKYVLIEEQIGNRIETPIDFGYDKQQLQQKADDLNKLAKDYFKYWKNLYPFYDNLEEIPENERKFYIEYYNRWNKTTIDEYHYFVQECQEPGYNK